MRTVYNFSAGPAMLPEKVLSVAADQMLDYNGSGQSVMEMSHRSKIFDEIIKEAEKLLRSVMNIPNNYKVLFLQGGASSQFSMVPLNLMNKNNKADYVITGQWATKAFNEALRYGAAREVCSSKDKNFSYIPKTEKTDFSPDADYIHICLNNTIYGTKFNKLPETGNIPLVADISSCILSEPIDVSKFGLLYAGAQKNMSCAGLTVVIVREDLIGNAMAITPTMFNYKTHADSNSLYNTPPCYAIYILKLVLEWIQNDIGGLQKMKELNLEKSSLLYDFLDNSNMFNGTVKTEDRSMMNITFITGDKELDSKFISGAEKNNLVNIKGHRSVGGMRTSLYNAMPIDGVRSLIEFMRQFEKENS